MYMRLPISDYLGLHLVPFRSYRRLLVQFWRKNDFAFLSPFGGLGATYTVHLWLIEKYMGDFLFVLIEVFSLCVTAETLYERILNGNRRF